MTNDTLAFAARVAEWQGFYSVMAGVSATFAGLLFVSLSINVTEFARPEHAGSRRLARHTFGSYIYLTIHALIFLIPRQVPLGLGLPLFVTGAMALVQTWRARAITDRERGVAIARERGLYRLSLMTYGVLMSVSVAVLFGNVVSLYALVTLMLWSLAWSTRLAWDLLFLRDSQQER